MRIERDNYWHVEYQSGRAGRPVLRELFDTIVLTVLIFVAVRTVVPSYWVEGESMQPTLESGQRLLVNRAAYFRYDASFFPRLFNEDTSADWRYLLGGPQRGDIIVFQPPKQAETQDDFIKRVIAVEGETVEVRSQSGPGGESGDFCEDCAVYVNGVKLEEPYIKGAPNYRLAAQVVPPGHVFVLGDNRRNSSDSHVWGPLRVEEIVGTAFVSYWPQDHLGFFPHPSYAGIEAKP